ncbi:MAG: heme biosynthesis HemY N-terminal domain-containing protein [Pseudomonadota bacterium]
MTIRILIFIVWIIFFAGALTLFLNVKSVVSAEAFGWRFDLPAGVAATIAIGIAAALIGATALLKDAFAAPKALRARRSIARQERGLAAMTKGLEALAAGDGRAASKQAQLAAKALGGAAATKLLAAQAAQISGDESAAGEALAAMLDAPETEFLALRGLYAKAMRDNDRVAALVHSTRAFELHPKAHWAFEAVFGLALDRGDFVAAKEILLRAAKAKAVETEKADRGVAAVSAAAAYAAHAEGDDALALAGAAAALRLAPDFAPAAVLAARLHARRGEARKAMKILVDGFALAPERAFADAVDEIAEGDPPASRANALDRLADSNPASIEAELLRARANLIRGNVAGAVAILANLLKSSATARALQLMAEAETALHGQASAHAWLVRAASAPREAALTADSYFRLTSDGWRRLIQEYFEHARLSPPPLEPPPPGLPAPEAAFLNPPKSDDIEESGGGGELPTGAETVDAAATDEALARDAAAARET